MFIWMSAAYPVMRVEIKSKMKGDLVKPPMISVLRWASNGAATTPHGRWGGSRESMLSFYPVLTSHGNTHTHLWGRWLAIHDWDIMVLLLWQGPMLLDKLVSSYRLPINPSNVVVQRRDRWRDTVADQYQHKSVPKSEKEASVSEGLRWFSNIGKTNVDSIMRFKVEVRSAAFTVPREWRLSMCTYIHSPNQGHIGDALSQSNIEKISVFTVT